MTYYWYIVTKQGDKVRVKPTEANLHHIKQKLQQGSGHIITRTQTINVYDVKEFYESDEPVVQVERLIGDGLAEDAARAFNEPLLSEDDEVICKPVKRQVSRKRWDQHYSKFSSYTVLEDSGDHLVIAYWLPTHLVDLHKHSLCEPAEIARIARS